MRDSLYTIGGFKLAFALAHFFPRAVNRWIATRIGLAAYKRSLEAQSALHSNLHLVGGLQGAELDALCEANVTNFSCMLADYFICAGPKAAKNAAALLHHDGGEQNLTAALAPGKGVIVV